MKFAPGRPRARFLGAAVRARRAAAQFEPGRPPALLLALLLGLLLLARGLLLRLLLRRGGLVRGLLVLPLLRLAARLLLFLRLRLLQRRDLAGVQVADQRDPVGLVLVA